MFSVYFDQMCLKPRLDVMGYILIFVADKVHLTSTQCPSEHTNASLTSLKKINQACVVFVQN